MKKTHGTTKHLPQKQLAQEILKSCLTQHGHCQSKLTLGFWLPKTHPIQFCLVSNKFGVKYNNQTNAEHLQTLLTKYYNMSMDWSGCKYVRLTLDWDYDIKQVHLSMPGTSRGHSQGFNIYPLENHAINLILISHQIMVQKRNGQNAPH